MDNKTQHTLYPLVVLSNRLPVAQSPDTSDHGMTGLSPGGLVAAVAPALAGKNAAWVGWSGDESGWSGPTAVDGIAIIAVSLETSLAQAHYEGYSNSTLWPLFHNVGIDFQESPDWFVAHQEANKRFAQAVAAVVEPGGMVWVHDYQVMLAPGFLRELRPDVRIGYFHHIPFPPLSQLRELEQWREIVTGLLAADVVGFQRPSDCENYAEALGELPAGVERASQLVRSYPISIDYPAVSEAAAQPSVHSRARALREQWGSARKVLLGVDRLDYTKGIPERLEAYEALLDQGRISSDTVVFVQAGSPSRESVEAYAQLQERVESIVQRINDEHSPSPGQKAVWYLAENLERDEMLALFVAADVMVVSSLRDGMNLVAKEFVACTADNPGVLVLSVHTGAADQMTDAILVDPTAPEKLQEALVQALEMPSAEAIARMTRLRHQVQTHDVAAWAEDFLTDLASQ